MSEYSVRSSNVYSIRIWMRVWTFRFLLFRTFLTCTGRHILVDRCVHDEILFRKLLHCCGRNGALSVFF